MAPIHPEPQFVETDIPARLDRLPWSRWHSRVIAALAVAWLLDGLEGSLGGSLAGALKARDTLAFTDAQLGLSSSMYLAGAVLGALIFGYLTDRLGRRRLFTWTLVLYVCSTTATGFSWNLASFTFFRVLTGAGIGGEYAAVNSAVDELVPARLRGRVDLWINGTFWLGILLGSGFSSVLLRSSVFGARLGWRLAFFSGVPLGAVVLWMRRYIPESPRWLLNRGAILEAEQVVQAIETAAAAQRGGEAHSQSPATRVAVRVATQPERKVRQMLALLYGPFRQRAILCSGLMIAQAFFYNSVFFSFSLVLLRYYGVSAAGVGYCFLPVAVTNFLGPVVLGRLFDTVGRRQMVAATYCLSGATLLASSLLFHQGRLSVAGQVSWWAATFFFASTAASSAYLSVSELFPQQVRATSIAVFYAFGTLAGGVLGPLVFGHLTGSLSRTPLLVGYSAAAIVMIMAGVAQAIWGVAAEGRSLEALGE